MDFDKILSQISDLSAAYLPKVALALVTLILGFWIANRLTRAVRKALERKGVQVELQGFLGSLVNALLKVAVLLAAADMVGIEAGSFMVILGSAGLAIGLALQGSLANFAGGVMILLFKPFKVGDLIEGEGHFGNVTAINVFVTTLLTPDNKTVIIPNGPLSSGSITNYTTAGKIRIDLVIGIGYGENIQKAREVMVEVMDQHPLVLKDPAPSVTVLELGDSSVNLAVRPYATPEDYWTVYFDITEQCKVALDTAGIDIPFPQRVIHNAN